MENNYLKIEDVYFAYTCIDEPKFKYNSKVEKEFAVTVILSKEQAKTFKKHKINKSIKEIDTAEFESKYKFPPPYPTQEEQYLASFTKPATYKDGNPRPDWTYPKTFIAEDGKVIEITSTKVGNGSFGNINLEIRFIDTLNSTCASLTSILVKNLVKYESTKKLPGAEWASEGELATTDSIQSEEDDLPF